MPPRSGLQTFAYVEHEYPPSTSLAPKDGFVSAAAGFAVGLLVDYTFLGIAVIPLEVVMHRAFLIIAIGIVAAESASRSASLSMWRRVPFVGLGLWVTGLLWALFLL